ncbi:hypothetical protein E2C01_036447 [Portunus trituberculatus]|uniref:Uncharacterized protein n=1 Tax=Portunus trituberculatus TaxID=210409 RepID=A0A5B7FBX4_PORTR|nr:hypothetical protein [Portunus trituberculatus]
MRHCHPNNLTRGKGAASIGAGNGHHIRGSACPAEGLPAEFPRPNSVESEGVKTIATEAGKHEPEV